MAVSFFVDDTASPPLPSPPQLLDLSSASTTATTRPATLHRAPPPAPLLPVGDAVDLSAAEGEDEGPRTPAPSTAPSGALPSPRSPPELAAVADRLAAAAGGGGAAASPPSAAAAVRNAFGKAAARVGASPALVAGASVVGLDRVGAALFRARARVGSVVAAAYNSTLGAQVVVGDLAFPLLAALKPLDLALTRAAKRAATTARRGVAALAAAAPPAGDAPAAAARVAFGLALLWLVLGVAPLLLVALWTLMVVVVGVEVVARRVAGRRRVE